VAGQITSTAIATVPSIRQIGGDGLALGSPAPHPEAQPGHCKAEGLDHHGRRARPGHPFAACGVAIVQGIPMLGTVAAGGLWSPSIDIQERLDSRPCSITRGLFALTVNGGQHDRPPTSNDGDVFLMKPVNEPSRLKAGTIVRRHGAGPGHRSSIYTGKGRWVRLEASKPRLCAAADRGPNRWPCKGSWCGWPPVGAARL